MHFLTRKEKQSVMSERGVFRIVVEGESYWKVTFGDDVREAEENSCFLDYYSSKDTLQSIRIN